MSDGQDVMNDIYNASVVVGLTSGYGYVIKKLAKQSFTPDPSTDLMNSIKFLLPVSAAFVTKRFLQEKGYIPKRI